MDFNRSAGRTTGSYIPGNFKDGGVCKNGRVCKDSRVCKDGGLAFN